MTADQLFAFVAIVLWLTLIALHLDDEGAQL